jgi:hypothetical protein
MARRPRSLGTVRFSKGFMALSESPKDQQRRRNKKWRLSREGTVEYVLRTMFYRAKTRAKKAGVPFDLKRSDLAIPAVCPVLGIPLRCNRGKAYDNSPSLDRVRPHLGYVLGNVLVMSVRANRIKNNSTTEELEAVARFMRRLENLCQ